MKIGWLIAIVCLAAGVSRAQTPLPTTATQQALNEYLQRLAPHIAAHAKLKTTYSIEVLESDSINAYAQPSGEIYLTRGLLKALDNEAELVFVLAQQLSYLQPRPRAPLVLPKPSAGHTLLIGLLSGAMIVYGGPVGARTGVLLIAREARHRTHPRPVAVSLATLPPAVILAADQFAIEYLHEAGYDPEAALSLLTKLRALRPQGYVKQSQLPAPPVTFQERLRVARRHLSKLPRKGETLLDSSTFQELKKRLHASPNDASSSR